MKISTIALTALISYSASSFAQDKPARFREKDTTAKVKTTKCDSPKSKKNKNNSIDTTQNSIPKHSHRYCPGCGMG